MGVCVHGWVCACVYVCTQAQACVYSYVHTCIMMRSVQAILITSQVTGLSSVKHSVNPPSLRTYVIASLIAKATDAPKDNGGSPTACAMQIQNSKMVRDMASCYVTGIRDHVTTKR